MALAALAAALPLAPLAAQRGNVTAEDAITTARQMYGPPTPTANCSKPKADQDQNEIVVCARQKQDDAQFRVKSTAELDPNSREATDDGVPHAPDVAGDGIFKGKGISLGGTPAPVYMLDFKLLPDTPQGSDAEKIAKGEKSAD